MWWNVCQFKLMRSRIEYILSLDHHMFEILGIWDPHKSSSENFTLHALLIRRTTQCHSSYLRGQRTFPLCLPRIGPLRLVDAKVKELNVIETPPPPQAHKPRSQSISAEFIHLIDSHATLWWWPEINRNQDRTLTQASWMSLSTDFLPPGGSVRGVYMCLPGYAALSTLRS